MKDTSEISTNKKLLPIMNNMYLGKPIRDIFVENIKKIEELEEFDKIKSVGSLYRNYFFAGIAFSLECGASLSTLKELYTKGAQNDDYYDLGKYCFSIIINNLEAKANHLSQSFDDEEDNENVLYSLKSTKEFSLLNLEESHKAGEKISLLSIGSIHPSQYPQYISIMKSKDIDPKKILEYFREEHLIPETNIMTKNEKSLEQRNSSLVYYTLQGKPVVYDRTASEAYQYLGGKWIAGPAIGILQDDGILISEDEFLEKFPGIVAEYTKQQQSKEKSQSIETKLSCVVYPKVLENKFMQAIDKFTDEEQKNIMKAYTFAQEIHKDQFRDEGTPYYMHCLLTALFVIEHGGTVEDTITALLHDIVEDTKFSFEEIQTKLKTTFGENIANNVLLLSKYLGTKELPMDEYINRFKSNPKTLKIKACDVLANAHSLYFQPDLEKKSRCMKDDEDTYIPLLQKEFPDIANHIKETLTYLKNNPTISDVRDLQIAKLKKEKELRAKL